MKSMKVLAAAGLAASVFAATPSVGGQSVLVSIDAGVGAGEVSPAQTLSVSVLVEDDLEGPGIFGQASLNYFAGSVVGSGPAEAANPQIDPGLPALAAPGMPSGPSILNVGASAGPMVGLTGGENRPLTFDVQIDPAAENGDIITLEYRGAVGFDTNGTIEVYDTTPTFGRLPLDSEVLTLTVVAGCVAADLVQPFGVLDGADVNAFITAFGGGESRADLNDDGVVDGADVNVFITQFGAGCP